MYVIHWYKVYYGTFVHQTNYRKTNLEYEPDPITKLKLRIQEDNKNIRKVCKHDKRKKKSLKKSLEKDSISFPMSRKISTKYNFLQL